MKKSTIGTVHTANIIFQSIFTMLANIGILVLCAWLATRYLGAPRWIYIPMILAGALIGIISTIRFIIAASRSLERLEKQHREDERRRRETSRTQSNMINKEAEDKSNGRTNGQ